MTFSQKLRKNEHTLQVQNAITINNNSGGRQSVAVRFSVGCSLESIIITNLVSGAAYCRYYEEL